MIIHLSPILESGLIYLIFSSNLFILLIYLAYSFCIRQTDGWWWSMCSVTQLCPTLCDPMDYGTPGSSVHGISLARRLEWAAISFCRGSSQPRDGTGVSCIVGRFCSDSHQGSPWFSLFGINVQIKN